MGLLYLTGFKRLGSNSVVLVNLENKIADYFTSKNEFTWEYQRNAIQAMQTLAIHRQVHRTWQHYLIEKKEEVGKGGYEQNSIGAQRKFRVAVTSLKPQSKCDCFSLAGLLLGKEKNLPSSCQGM